MDGQRGQDRFLLIGGGIAALAAAAFLVRDAGVAGDRIRLLEAGTRPGGALRSGAAAAHPDLFHGNAVRSMDERASACLWDLLGSIPTLGDPRLTVLDEIKKATRGRGEVAGPTGTARLVVADPRTRRRSADAPAIDRADLLATLRAAGPGLAGRRVDQVLPADQLASDFWVLWSTTFRLRPGSSAQDLHTALMRHPLDLHDLLGFAGLRRTRRSEYESIIRPLHGWLQRQGVAFTHGATVTGMDVGDDRHGGRRATRLHFTTRDTPNTLELAAHDHVLATLGTLTANAAHGDDDHPPAPDLVHPDETRLLWETLARRHADFGHPAVFTAHLEDTAWLSFTLSSTVEDLNWRLRHLIGDRGGADGPITFRDSPWLLTVAVPRQPHFTGQAPAIRTALGYGMRLDTPGDHVPIPMLEATGRQLLDELLGQLGDDRVAAIVRASTSTRSTLLPYAGSPLLPRSPGDRPDPVPAGARNFAFLGQYVEIPEDVPFSMEYSARSAMHAVYGLLGLDRPIPPGFRDPAAAMAARPA